MRVCEKGLEKESFVLVVGKKIERTNATRKRQQKRQTDKQTQTQTQIQTRTEQTKKTRKRSVEEEKNKYFIFIKK